MTTSRPLPHALDAGALDTLFREARTAQAFRSEPVPDATLRQIVELAFWGPTSSNLQPLRIVFVRSAEAKDALCATLSPGNVEKTRLAPVTAIFAADVRFYEHAPRINPYAGDVRARFEGAENAARTREFATMNATLQGAYAMLAARALGLDVGPMGGFDRAAVDAHFFPDGRCISIWLANLGLGDDAKLRPRNPRLTFDEVATIV